MRQCPHCGEIRPLDEFYECGHSWCRPCARQNSRECKQRRRAANTLARQEEMELQLISDDGAPSSRLRLRAHRDELIALELELAPRLQLSSDGSLLSSPI